MTTAPWPRSGRPSEKTWRTFPSWTRIICFTTGTLSVPCRRVRETQERFLALVERRPSSEELERAIDREFTLYRAAGRKGNRHVLFTGYFEPVYEGSLIPDETYRYPLYGLPDDVLRIDLSPFSDALRGKRITARIEGKKLLPYHSRQEIEEGGALRERGLEIAWLKDPVDVAFLHIQGSGRIRLPDGTAISVGYAGANGRSYRSIGRYMLDHGYLTREEMSMQAIRRYPPRPPRRPGRRAQSQPLVCLLQPEGKRSIREHRCTAHARALHRPGLQALSKRIPVLPLRLETRGPGRRDSGVDRNETVRDEPGYGAGPFEGPGERTSSGGAGLTPSWRRGT